MKVKKKMRKIVTFLCVNSESRKLDFKMYTFWGYAAGAPFAKNLAPHSWSLPRFSGFEKSLKSLIFNSPSSSTRVNIERESYSSVLPSAVEHKAVACVEVACHEEMM